MSIKTRAVIKKKTFNVQISKYFLVLVFLFFLTKKLACSGNFKVVRVLTQHSVIESFSVVFRVQQYGRLSAGVRLEYMIVDKTVFRF